MARNVMYPDDQRSTKMVTFSSMPPDMEETAAEICVKAVMKFSLEEDIAEFIKQVTDKPQQTFLLFSPKREAISVSLRIDYTSQLACSNERCLQQL